jgi:hypothetical protein
MRIVAAILFAATIIVSAAKATAVDDLFREFGLYGTWARDCAQAASPANPHVSITTPSPGRVLEDHDLGPDFAINHYGILSAERVSGTRLSVKVIFQPGSEAVERQTLVFRILDGTRRTMFNQPDGGPVRVKDGMVVGHGLKTPVLHKCK